MVSTTYQFFVFLHLFEQGVILFFGLSNDYFIYKLPILVTEHIVCKCIIFSSVSLMEKSGIHMIIITIVTTTIIIINIAIISV